MAETTGLAAAAAGGGEQEGPAALENLSPKIWEWEDLERTGIWARPAAGALGDDAWRRRRVWRGRAVEDAIAGGRRRRGSGGGARTVILHREEGLRRGGDGRREGEIGCARRGQLEAL